MTTGKAQGRKESGAEGCVPEKDWGGRGCRGQRGKKVKESWKSLLFQEMAQIGREQTTERGRWPFMSFMLQQPSATGLVRLQRYSETPPRRHSSLTYGQYSLSTASYFKPLWTSRLFKKAAFAQPRVGKNLTPQDSRRKGHSDFFTQRHQFIFNHCERNQMEVWSISNFPFLIKEKIPSPGNNLKGAEIMWEDFLFPFKTFFSTEENKSTDFILFFVKIWKNRHLSVIFLF